MKVTPVGKKFGKYQVGQEFELPMRAAKVFIKVGKLAAVPSLLTPEQGEAAARSHLYSTRMMQAGLSSAVSVGAAKVNESREVLNGAEAPYGYKADGTPRKRPGRTKAAE